MATLRVYRITPYNMTDVPNGKALLDANSTYQDFECTTLTNDCDAIRTFRYDSTVTHIGAGDYCAFGDRVYNVIGFRQVNNEVAEITCKYNPIATDGYATYHVTGVCNRLTPTYDENAAADNYLTEPFVPSQMASTTTFTQQLGFPTGSTTQIKLVASTIDLDAVREDNITRITSYNYSKDSDGNIRSTGSETLLPDNMIPAAQETTVVMPISHSSSSGLFNRSYRTTGCGIYILNDTTLRTLNYLNACGMEASQYIIKKWQLPEKYATIVKDSDDKTHVKSITGPTPGTNNADNTVTASLDSWHTTTNSKAFYYGATVTITSLISGDTRTFKFWEVLSDTTTTSDNIVTQKASFRVAANPGPGGKPFLYPVQYRGSTSFHMLLPRAIQGASWYEPGISVANRTGALLAQYNTEVDVENNALAAEAADINAAAGSGNLALQGITAGVSSVTNPGGLGGATGTTAGLLSQGASLLTNDLQKQTIVNNTARAINNQVFANRIATPVHMPASMDGALALLPNTFSVSVQNYSSEDRSEFNKFLTRFGWASNKTLDDELSDVCDERGSYFTFIQMNACSVVRDKATGYNAQQQVFGDTAIVEEMLKRGVRVWKTGSPTSFMGSNIKS